MSNNVITLSPWEGSFEYLLIYRESWNNKSFSYANIMNSNSFSDGLRGFVIQHRVSVRWDDFRHFCHVGEGRQHNLPTTWQEQHTHQLQECDSRITCNAHVQWTFELHGGSKHVELWRPLWRHIKVFEDRIQVRPTQIRSEFYWSIGLCSITNMNLDM